jgi:flagellar biosynthesis chaperone FliJ
MAFRFPLAAVLRIRESLERKEQMLLEQCYQRLYLLQMRLSQVDERREGWQHGYEEKLTGGTRAVELHMLLDERQRMERQRKEILGQIAAAQEALTRQMQTYRAVRQQREIVAQLRKDSLEEYQRREQLQEQKLRDDLFLLRRHRRDRQTLPTGN